MTKSFKELASHLCGETKGNHENLSQDSETMGQDLNLGPPKCKQGR
jgi:hypothetical protein